MKILLLFSGGLDSILAYFILKENNFNIYPVQFYTPFSGIKNLKEYRKYYLEKFNINVDLIDIFDEFKYILTNPKHGYGKNLNPCLDCKLLFYKKAKQIMLEKNFHCIATGEVVGQRPFSQMSNTITFLEKNSGLKDRILRPLCYQKSLKIENKEFFYITGRGRKKQIELADKYNINVKEITPAGGCLLTDPLFAKKCKSIIDFFDNNPENLKSEYFEIIKYGRIINEENFILIIGKNKIDNEALLKFKYISIKANIKFIVSKNDPAPVTVAFYKKLFNIEKISQIIKNYVKEKYRNTIKFEIIN